MGWLKKLGKGASKVGFGLKAALGSTVAIEIAETLAKSNPDIPPEVASAAKLALNVLIIYKMAFNNADGTPSTTPYVPQNNAKGK